MASGLHQLYSSSILSLSFPSVSLHASRKSQLITASSPNYKQTRFTTDISEASSRAKPSQTTHTPPSLPYHYHPRCTARRPLFTTRYCPASPTYPCDSLTSHMETRTRLTYFPGIPPRRPLPYLCREGPGGLGDSRQGMRALQHLVLLSVCPLSTHAARLSILETWPEEGRTTFLGRAQHGLMM